MGQQTKMSSTTLNGVGSIPNSSVSKIINLVSDDEQDSENDGTTLKTVSHDTSRGMSHHQNASPQDVDEVLSANESSSEDNDEDEDDEDEEDLDTDEMESLLEGWTDSLITSNESNDSNLERCTPEEAMKYRSDLRRLGPREFCENTVEAGIITAKKLLTAFGILPPLDLEGGSDEEYYELLAYALRRELLKRAKLPEYNSVADAVKLIKNAKKIIVLTGAGISTSLGIPDFRSANGLYSQLGSIAKDLTDPQDVFSIEIFKQQPEIFFGVAKMILPSIVRPSPTHKFIWLLQNKGKLLTNYTQNIDNIEKLAGILPENIIHCHGSFATATCQKCAHQVKGEEIFQEIKDGVIPRCKKCAAFLLTQKPKRKRTQNGSNKKRPRYSEKDDYDDDDDYDQGDLPEAGIMKPDITFFGEELSSDFSDRLSKCDKDQVDLVITIGTSLKVAPVSHVVPYLPSNVPQIQINRDPIGHLTFDIDLLGECDVVISALCKALGWNLDHEMVPKDQEIEISTDPEHPNRHRFKDTTPCI